MREKKPKAVAVVAASSPLDVSAEKKAADKALAFAGSLEVKSQEDYDAALTEGKRIKTFLDGVVARKEEITKPQNDALKSVRALFKPIETGAEEALKTIKSKMLGFTTEQQRIAAAAKEKIDARVEKGTMRMDTAIDKKAAIVEPPKSTTNEAGRATTSMITKYRVTDKSKVPLEFMEVNMVAVKQAYKLGTAVPGTEAYQEANLSLN